MKMEPAKSFTADPAQPLRKLSEALRAPETWPPGFNFSFLFTHQCALGLASELGMIKYYTARAAMDAFGLSAKELDKIFYEGGEIEVSAAMVADRIDAYLARQGSAK